MSIPSSRLVIGVLLVLGGNIIVLLPAKTVDKTRDECGSAGNAVAAANR